MTMRLVTKAIEQSTYVVEVSFTDEDGESVTPTTLEWTLCDRYGTIVNNREGVEVLTPSSTESIVLTGDDLALEGFEDDDRVLIVNATYDSDLGEGLSLKGSIWFKIEKLVVLEE